MCDRHAEDRPRLPPGLAALPNPPAAPAGSRRRRVWELPPSCHCPLIGVCLPLTVARKLVDKALGGAAQGDDYEVHVGLVHECRQRSPMSEGVQRELETRYALIVRRFAAAKCADTLLARFFETADGGEMAGALWAALSHPRCDAAVQDAIYRAVHMRQHQAGAMARADTTRAARLAEEHAAQAREIERLQQRVQQLQADKALEAERAEGRLMRLRAEGITKESLIASLRAELADLQQTVPELATRLSLARRLDDANARNAELVRQLGEARQAAGARREAAAPEPAHPAAAAASEVPEQQVVPIHLQAKSVLCVGGRHAAVSVYRDLVEKHGGRFIHHDGGREDNPRALDASLAAADLVICQAGCISHNAYWLVKDHCKRTGKRCVYVDKPSAASFAKGLAALPDAAATASTDSQG